MCKKKRERVGVRKRERERESGKEREEKKERVREGGRESHSCYVTRSRQNKCDRNKNCEGNKLKNPVN